MVVSDHVGKSCSTAQSLVNWDSLFFSLTKSCWVPHRRTHAHRTAEPISRGQLSAGEERTHRVVAANMPSSKVPGLPIGVMGPSDIVPFQDPWEAIILISCLSLQLFSLFCSLHKNKRWTPCVCDSLERAKEHCTSVTSACAAIEVR
jgi:hypothetical protein